MLQLAGLVTATLGARDEAASCVVAVANDADKPGLSYPCLDHNIDPPIRACPLIRLNTKLHIPPVLSYTTIIHLGCSFISRGTHLRLPVYLPLYNKIATIRLQTRDHQEYYCPAFHQSSVAWVGSPPGTSFTCESFTSRPDLPCEEHISDQPTLSDGLLSAFPYRSPRINLHSLPASHGEARSDNLESVATSRMPHSRPGYQPPTGPENLQDYRSSYLVDPVSILWLSGSARARLVGPS
ncbi:hypothetical protein V8F06_000623 [Rhypophila decipiens]